jgi:glycosyltransferase involved in cell wall biosynthesis
LTADSFSADSIPFGIYNFDHNVAARQADERYSALITDAPEFRANIFHINADQMGLARDVLGGEFFRDRYNIGYWAWELSVFPDDWLPATELVDEIWAPSRFIQHALSEKARCPVVWMPLAVRPPVVDSGAGKDFGIAPDCFAFLFYFDFASFATRKNPTGPIAAFRRAFPDARNRVQLIIKVMAHDVHAPEVARLRKQVADDPRIRIIDEVLSHSEMALLLDRCDCFVSLHRSEGFGRGMAEAMAMGKPVIATNYSGNTDFMNSENSLLVNYSLVPVGKGEYVHWEGQVWAEPDIEQAAWYMRKVVDDPQASRAMGVAASSYIRDFHSPRAIGVRYRNRLARLGLL